MLAAGKESTTVVLVVRIQDWDSKKHTSIPNAVANIKQTGLHLLFAL